jgi:hypothetical protein
VAIAGQGHPLRENHHDMQDVVERAPEAAERDEAMTERIDLARRAPVQLVRSADPVADARTIAQEAGADLAADLRTAERAVRARVDAGRHALGDPDADAELIARADAVREAASHPAPFDEREVAELRRAANELSRASRIRQRTASRVTQSLSDRLATSTGVTLHPEAIRAAAKAVHEARETVAVADAALADLDGPPARAGEAGGVGPDADVDAYHRDLIHHLDHEEEDTHEDGVIDAVLQRPHDVFDEAALDRRRTITQAAAAFLVLAGLGLIAMALSQPLIGVAAIVAGVGAAVAVVLSGRSTTTSATGAADQHVASTWISAPRVGPVEPVEPVAPTVDQPEERPVPTEPVAAEVDSVPELQRAVLIAEREEAIERLRVIEARWHRLAGPDADPLSPEAAIRAHDPQLLYDPQLAEASPTVRTVAAFHRKAQARWRVLWASFGVEEPPEPERLDLVLEDLLGDLHHARGELRELEAAEARAAARATVARALVLVEPSSWLSPPRLTQLLASLPADGRAIVVEREPTATEPAPEPPAVDPRP